MNIRVALCALSLVALAAPCEASVTISTNATQNMSCSAGVCSPTAKKAVLNVNDLANMLASGDTTVKSDSVAQDIEIDAALSWTSTSRLTLDSYHSITFSKPVTVAGTGALTITTNDGGTNGDFQFADKARVEFWDSDASLVINNQAYTLIDSMKALIRQFRHTSEGYYALRENFGSKKVYSTSPIDKEFQGTLEGLGNKISNLTVNNVSSGDVGLFAAIGALGTVRDLILSNVNLSGSGSGELVGGLARGNEGSILNCFVSGAISASGTGSKVGALAGNNGGDIRNSGANAFVSGSGASQIIGGLVGENLSGDGTRGTIEGSYGMGTVTGSDGAMLGGLVGENFGAAISNSYATGAVSGGGDAEGGGLIGLNANNSNFGFTPTLSDSYSTGVVSGGSGAVLGGLIGSDTAQTGTTNTYWDVDTSGVGNPHQGAGNVADDPGITGLTDVQLKSGLPSGFDPKIWAQNQKINNGYPYLLANPPPQ